MLNHEKLRVYKKSIKLSTWVGKTLDAIPRRFAVHDQLDRASTSVCLNIAEGAGKYTVKDKAKFYDIARGSALECGACLDVAVSRNIMSNEEVLPGKEMIIGIVNMLVGLVRADNPDRRH